MREGSNMDSFLSQLLKMDLTSLVIRVLDQYQVVSFDSWDLDNMTFLTLHNDFVFSIPAKHYRMKVMGLYKHNYNQEYSTFVTYMKVNIEIRIEIQTKVLEE